MRIRYAYKLDMGNDQIAYVTLNQKKSEEEVQEKYADKGCVGAAFHERVRTGFRIGENGELVSTGLVTAKDAPKPAPAKAQAPKAKKAKKAHKKG